MDVLAKIGGFLVLLAYLAALAAFRMWLYGTFRPASQPPPEEVTREQKLLLGFAFVLPVVIMIGFVYFSTA